MASSPRKWLVNQLTHSVKITNDDGTPKPEFIQQWNLLLELVKQVTTNTDDVVALEAVTVDTTAPISGGGPILELTPIEHDTSGVTPDTYGDSTHVAQVTVDEFGHVTEVTDVAIAFPSGESAPRGAMASRTTNQSITLNTDTLVQFDTENYDDGGFITLASANTKITIPSGYNRAILFAECFWDAIGGNKFLQIKKNGSFTYPGAANVVLNSGVGTDRIQCSTGVMAVTNGDFFEVNVNCSQTHNVNPVYFSIIAWNVP